MGLKHAGSGAGGALKVVCASPTWDGAHADGRLTQKPARPPAPGSRELQREDPGFTLPRKSVSVKGTYLLGLLPRRLLPSPQAGVNLEASRADAALQHQAAPG